MNSPGFELSASQGARRAWTLAGLSLLVAALGVAAMVKRAGGCARYEELRVYAEQQSLPATESCFDYLMDHSIIPSFLISLPLLFCAGMLGYKERRFVPASSTPQRLRHERWAYRAGSGAIALLLLNVVFIRSIRCEGFGCLGLAPLIALTVIVFPLLHIASVLWFAWARYEWIAWRLVASAAILAVLAGLAYATLLGT